MTDPRSRANFPSQLQRVVGGGASYPQPGNIYRLGSFGLARYAYFMKLYGSLDNYIQMHRQRAGLSQADLSLLIAVEKRGTVSRYEQGVRLPSLHGLLALEIVLGQPIQELFAGLHERVLEDVSSRARTLLESLDDAPRKDLAVKIEILSKLAHLDEHRIVPIWEGQG